MRPPRERLRAELTQPPLGHTLATELLRREQPLFPATSYLTHFTQLEDEPAAALLDHKEFWTGSRPLPAPPTLAASAVAALLVKTQGDNPAFWHQDASFVATMVELYERVRTKSPNMR